MRIDPRSRYQHAQPIIVSSMRDEAGAIPLKRATLSSAAGAPPAYSESWLQRLIHRHPILLPVSEIEPALGGLIPVGIELPTAAGPVDNLMATPEGNLVLIECKLWRNAEARRRVVAQILDYAQSVSEWSYHEFDEAIAKSQDLEGKPVSKPLTEIVRGALGEGTEFEEAAFIDAVQRNLRLGRMLLLVVGDGIREGTASLGEFIQRHAGLHFTLGLVETAIYELPEGGLLVQPRVLTRTLNIERAVVRVLDGKPVIETGTAQGAGLPATTMSEDDFFERLAASSPETAAALRDFLQLQQQRDLRVFLQPARRSAGLRWESPDGKVFTLGAIDLDGKLNTYSVCWTPDQTGQLDLAHKYLHDLASLAGGTVRQTKHPAQWYVVSSGVIIPPALPVLNRAEDWIELMAKYQQRLSAAD